MSVLHKVLLTAGAVLNIAGSFWLWEQGGDLVPYWVFGIQIYPSIEDNGGALIVLMTIAYLLVDRFPEKIERPTLMKFFICLILFLDAVSHFVNVLSRHIEAGSIIGAPIVETGLMMILAGSILLGASFFLTSKKPFHPPSSFIPD